MTQVHNVATGYTPSKARARTPIGARIRAVLTRAHRAISAAQEAKAKAFVLPYLARLDDAKLKELGHSEDEIRVIRKHSSRPISY